jgi:hypothetical protein
MKQTDVGTGAGKILCNVLHILSYLNFQIRKRGGGVERNKYKIAVTKLVLETHFLRNCLSDSLILKQLGLFESEYVPQ